VIMARFLFLWIIAFNAVTAATIGPQGTDSDGLAEAPPSSTAESAPTSPADILTTTSGSNPTGAGVPQSLGLSPSLSPTQGSASVSFPNSAATTTSTTTGLSMQPTPPKSHKSPNTAAIAGGVIGGLGGILLIALMAYFLRRRRLSKRSGDDNGYGKAPSDLVYRTTDMSSESSPATHQTQYGQLPKAIERAYPGPSHPLTSQASQEPNYAEQHNASREAAKVILSPVAIRPQGQPAPPVPPTNELDSTEVNEDGVSVRSPSPDIDIDGRLDSIRGPTPTPESQAARGNVPRLPLISRTKGHDPTI
jgi:hypothetical protein